MSTIDKLLIRGIRSFDPKGDETVKFYTPLTLIVGHNGSGKTVRRGEFGEKCAFLKRLGPRCRPSSNASSTSRLAIYRPTVKVEPS